jgi:DNA-directed RNA polymerase I, II, and III subunit RPABC2
MNYLTKFETVRILGQRAEQISCGAPPMVDITGMDNALTIAKKELKEKKIPLKIRRTYPGGEVREFAIFDMEMD